MKDLLFKKEIIQIFTVVIVNTSKILVIMICLGKQETKTKMLIEVGKREQWKEHNELKDDNFIINYKILLKINLNISPHIEII